MCCPAAAEGKTTAYWAGSWVQCRFLLCTFRSTEQCEPPLIRCICQLPLQAELPLHFHETPCVHVRRTFPFEWGTRASRHTSSGSLGNELRLAHSPLGMGQVVWGKLHHSLVTGSCEQERCACGGVHCTSGSCCCGGGVAAELVAVAHVPTVAVIVERRPSLE
jgi:hypothetical protein